MSNQKQLSPFHAAYAAHPDWKTSAENVIAQLQNRPGHPPGQEIEGLGLLYLTEAMNAPLRGILQLFRQKVPLTHWVCQVVPGICANGAEYMEKPALSAMVLPLKRSAWWTVSASPDATTCWSSRRTQPATMLVHATQPELAVGPSMAKLAASTQSGFLFGGIVIRSANSFAEHPPPPQQLDISGIAFSQEVRLLSRATHSCIPLGQAHTISHCTSHYIRDVDGRPALDVLLADLGISMGEGVKSNAAELLQALPDKQIINGLMVGLASRNTALGHGLSSYEISDVVGIDPKNRLLAITTTPRPGDRAIFCTRDKTAARTDLIRICTELREELESLELSVQGAHYVCCIGRGANLFGFPEAEIDLISHNFGNVPLIGFFTEGEVAGSRIHRHSGVLSLFVQPKNATKFPKKML